MTKKRAIRLLEEHLDKLDSLPNVHDANVWISKLLSYLEGFFCKESHQYTECFVFKKEYEDLVNSREKHPEFSLAMMKDFFNPHMKTYITIVKDFGVKRKPNVLRYGNGPIVAVVLFIIGSSFGGGIYYRSFKVDSEIVEQKQLLREKDEKIKEQKQLIDSIINSVPFIEDAKKKSGKDSTN